MKPYTNSELYFVAEPNKPLTVISEPSQTAPVAKIKVSTQIIMFSGTSLCITLIYVSEPAGGVSPKPKPLIFTLPSHSPQLALRVWLSIITGSFMLIDKGLLVVHVKASLPILAARSL